MNIKSTNSWGYKNNGKWDGIVRMVMNGEIDFPIVINAMRTERLEVCDYTAISIWKYGYTIL